MAVCDRWLPALGDIYILSLLFQCLEMLFREHIHPVFTFLKRKDYYFQPDSSLQTESPRQGCIAPGFFILADRISSSGMHRPGIFHPCRQNLLDRDASSPQLCPKLAGRTRSPPSSPQFTSTPAGRPRSPPSSPQFTSTLAGRTLIKPAVPIFKLPAFIPDDLFPVSRGTFRIQFPHDEFSLRMTSSVST